MTLCAQKVPFCGCRPKSCPCKNFLLQHSFVGGIYVQLTTFDVSFQVFCFFSIYPILNLLHKFHIKPILKTPEEIFMITYKSLLQITIIYQYLIVCCIFSEILVRTCWTFYRRYINHYIFVFMKLCCILVILFYMYWFYSWISYANY